MPAMNLLTRLRSSASGSTESALVWHSTNTTERHAVPDHQWAEIHRTRMTAPGMYKKHAAKDYALAEEGVDGYGCWFNLLLPPFPSGRGSGIFVNTGRSLVLPDREAASRYFRSSENRARATWCRDNAGLCLAVKGGGGGLDVCTDRCWAAKAHAAGFDTVQILRGPNYSPELIVSSSACLSQKVPIGTCPPAQVELRMRERGEGATAMRACHCSERRAVLNCGDGGAPAATLRTL